MMILQTTSLLLLSLLPWVYGDSHDIMSKHFILARHLAGVTNVVLTADAVTTEGPFFKVESDYVNTTDLTAAAYAGSPGVTTDRSTVVDGIPFYLTLGFYDVTNSSGVTGPLVGAEIFIWHADATGVYSSVDSQMQTEVTTGQVWLRATQITDASGTVFFKTILPGWYGGRAVHWHLRVKLAGSTSYAATTQMFLPDAFVTGYSTVSPYTKDSNSLTTLATDTVYPTLNSDVAAALVLQPVGSTATGYNASLNFGVDISANTSSTTSPPFGGPSPPNGTGIPPNGTIPFPTPNGTALSPPPLTLAPVAPTLTPIAPTSTPIAPTFTPIAPTLAPITPTSTPFQPTSKPVASSTAKRGSNNVKNAGPVKTNGKNKAKFTGHRSLSRGFIAYQNANE